MRQLSVKETETVSGGHPIVWIIGFVVRSTVTRAVVKGIIGGVAAWGGWRLSQGLRGRP